MADSLHLGTIDQLRGSFAPVLDLQHPEGPSGYCTGRGTLSIGGVNPQIALAAAQRPRAAGRAVRRTDEARSIGGQWRVKGSSHADCIAKVEELLSRVGSGHLGRWLRWRPEGHSEHSYMRLTGPGSWQSNYQWSQYHQAQGIDFDLSWPIEPDAYGLPWDVFDDWLDTTLSDWTIISDTGSFTPAPGYATFGGSGQLLMFHNGRGEGDRRVDEAFCTFTWETAFNAIGVVLGYNPDGDYLYGQHNRSAGTLTIWKFESGTGHTQLATVAVSALASGVPYTLHLGRQNRFMTVDLWQARHPSHQSQTPWGTVSATLTAAEADQYLGRAGLRVLPGGAMTPGLGGLHGFYRRPFTWQLPSGLPRVVVLDSLPGTEEGPRHEVDVTVMPRILSPGQRTDWGLIAHTPHPRRQNLIWNGLMENLTPAGGNSGWLATGTGLNAGATVAINENGYAQIQSINAVGRGMAWNPTGSTSGSRIWRHFDRAVPITVEFEARASEEITLETLLGDVAASYGGGSVTDTFLNVPNNWTKRTLTWVPGATGLGASLVFRTGADFASTSAIELLIRNVKVYDAAADPVTVPARGGAAPIGQLLPADCQLFTLTASDVDGATGAFTITSVPATWGPSISWVLDPEMVPPTEFGAPFVVEVYLQMLLPSTWAAPAIRGSLTPLDMLAGATQWLSPHGSAGRLVVPPTSGTRRRTYKVGMFTINPQDVARRRLMIQLAAAGGSGTATIERAILAPVSSRASLPTARQPDSAYPFFLPLQTGSSYESRRTVHSDLAMSVSRERTGVSMRDSSMGGEPIKVAGGDVALLAWALGGVPDDPTSDAHDETIPGRNSGGVDGPMYLHAAVTPRYNLAAPAS